MKHQYINRLLSTVIFTLIALAFGCSESMNSSNDSPRMGGGDGDSDSDMDSDSDSDGDSDMDGDSDSDADAYSGDWEWDTDSELAPEIEERFDYRIPQSSGKYVFIADQANNNVVAVDSGTLGIHITEVGARPSHLVPLDDNGNVAVLALNSDEVAILRTDDAGNSEVTEIDVRQDTNALATSSDGRWVIAFWDPLFAAESGAPGTDQDISVINTTEGSEKVYDMCVGMHPLEVLFNKDNTRAFVITESGISTIDLQNIATETVPEITQLFKNALIDPDLTEVAIDAAGTVAIGRRDDSQTLSVAWLDGSEEKREYELHSYATDLDLAEDGSYGMLTLKYTNEVAVFDIPLPDDAESDPFTYISLEGLTFGAAVLTPDGNKAALYTTVQQNDFSERKILTILTKQSGEWELESIQLNRKIKSVKPTPDSGSLVVDHGLALSQELTAASMPYAYSIVSLPGLQTKFQQIPTDPIQLLLTPDGDFGYLLLPGATLDVINLNTLIVDSISLGSVPTAAGYTAETDKVFVAQDHPSGRMTFMDVEGENIKTVTGYTLNDENSN